MNQKFDITANWFWLEAKWSKQSIEFKKLQQKFETKKFKTNTENILVQKFDITTNWFWMKAQ